MGSGTVYSTWLVASISSATYLFAAIEVSGPERHCLLRLCSFVDERGSIIAEIHFPHFTYRGIVQNLFGQSVREVICVNTNEGEYKGSNTKEENCPRKHLSRSDERLKSSLSNVETQIQRDSMGDGFWVNIQSRLDHIKEIQ